MHVQPWLWGSKCLQDIIPPTKAIVQNLDSPPWPPVTRGSITGLEIVTRWLPMGPKIELWQLNLQNWSPAGIICKLTRRLKPLAQHFLRMGSMQSVMFSCRNLLWNMNKFIIILFILWGEWFFFSLTCFNPNHGWEITRRLFGPHPKTTCYEKLCCVHVLPS